jgi:hypothetical protein
MRELVEEWTKGDVPRDSWGELSDRRRSDKRKAIVPFEKGSAA